MSTCTPDPYHSCDPAKPVRTVLRLHLDEATRDPMWAETALVLDFNDGGIADHSPAARPMQLVGPAFIGQSRSLFGTSAYENTTPGTAAGCETANATLAFDNTTQSMTVEVDAWWAGGSTQTLLSIGGALEIYVTAAGALMVLSEGVARLTSGTLAPGQWARVMLQHYQPLGNRLEVSLDGNAVFSGSGSPWIGSFTNAMVRVGKGSQQSWLGSVAQVRITLRGLTTPRYADNSYRTQPFPFGRTAQATVADTSCARPKVCTLLGAATTGGTARWGRGLYTRRTLNSAEVEDGLRVQADSDFQFGTGDWSLRFWLRVAEAPAPAGQGRVMAVERAPGSAMQVNIDSARRLFVTYSTSGGDSFGNMSFLATDALPLDTPRQVLIQRRGGLVETYLHGVRIDSRAIHGGAGSTCDFTGDWFFARTLAASAIPFDGWVDEIDIVRGIALADGTDFTPQALPNCDQADTLAACIAWPAGTPQ